MSEVEKRVYRYYPEYKDGNFAYTVVDGSVKKVSRDDFLQDIAMSVSVNPSFLKLKASNFEAGMKTAIKVALRNHIKIIVGTNDIFFNEDQITIDANDIYDILK